MFPKTRLKLPKKVRRGSTKKLQKLPYLSVVLMDYPTLVRIGLISTNLDEEKGGGLHSDDVSSNHRANYVLTK